MVPVAQSVGVRRLYPSQSIKYPLGFPGLGEGEEKAERVALLRKVLDLLCVDTEEIPG